MKKSISILLSLVMMIIVCSASMSAMAKNTLISPETTQKKVVIKVTLNGETSNSTSYQPDKDNPNVLTFTYTGDGELIGWDFPEMEEGKDYIIVSKDGDKITIQVLDNYEGERIWANAKDKYPGETTNPAKKDNSNKSPNTGATTGVGVALAGLAIIMASKKRK